MELQKEGAHDQSLEILRDLMQDEPPYVPAFFMSAKQLIDLGRVPAGACLRLGIQQARDQGNAHAAAEMSELLATLGALGE